MNEDETVQVDDPVLELPADDDDFQTVTEPSVPPMEVVPVDELFERLDEYFNQEDSSEESEEAGEAPSDEPEEIIEASQEMTDLPGSDLDPVIGILDDLTSILSGQGEAFDLIEEQLSTVIQVVDHPALTTPFEDYTVTEALLLFLLLFAFVSACARMLRGGFSWLRS